MNSVCPRKESAFISWFNSELYSAKLGRSAPVSSRVSMVEHPANPTRRWDRSSTGLGDAVHRHPPAGIRAQRAVRIHRQAAEAARPLTAAPRR